MPDYTAAILGNSALVVILQVVLPFQLRQHRVKPERDGGLFVGQSVIPNAAPVIQRPRWNWEPTTAYKAGFGPEYG
jgi:hypothetical protein